MPATHDMTETTLSLTDDLSQGVVYLATLLLLLSVALLLFELARQKRRSVLVFVTGLLGTIAVGLSVFRPVAVTAKTNQLGPRVVVLVDHSRRLLLPEGKGDRDDLAAAALKELTNHYKSARLSVLGFGEGEPHPLADAARGRANDSDLVGALNYIRSSPGERPQAIVVVSDGRLTRPAEGAEALSLQQNLGSQLVPVHTVSLLQQAPTDASIRLVKTAGAAVAHQALSMTVEVGCSRDLDCSQIPVKVEELLHGERPVVLASGVAKVSDGSAKIELQITLDRAGSRVLRVSIRAPKADSIPENNERYLTFAVAKERVRLLHLAGRPTYDVRALRRWLKSDESVDVVAFFILRGEDDPGASESELALIRFPVDELFTEHLPSFDAIILQDIDAIRYNLTRYLVSLQAYVKKGGGLIMVGGPSSFAGGNYAGTPLDSVLPVEQPRQGNPFDSGDFVPTFTEAGRVAPVTSKLRALLGGELPEMSGANILGAPRPGAIVLLEHPRLSVGDRAMPVLALGEAGDGRAIALGVDSTHRLAFGQLASTASGRGYGALWDGLLGWLMRDPRYEAARVSVQGECIEGQPTTLTVQRLPGMIGDIQLTLSRLSGEKMTLLERQVKDNHSAGVDIPLSGLETGGYTARVSVGAAPATRHDFGCEKGGLAWADSRPDPPRLAAISAATGGTAVKLGGVAGLALPEVTEVTAERHARPLLPAWVWTLASSLLLGAHWVARRQTGLT